MASVTKQNQGRLRSLTNHINNVEGNKHNKRITSETRISTRAYTATGDFQGQTKSEEIPPTRTRFRRLRIRREQREIVDPRVLARRIPIANDTAKTMIRVTTNEFMKSLLPQKPTLECEAIQRRPARLCWTAPSMNHVGCIFFAASQRARASLNCSSLSSNCSLAWGNFIITCSRC